MLWLVGKMQNREMGVCHYKNVMVVVLPIWV